MSTYKELFGKYVQSLATDPPAVAEGQIWYNTTSNTFKTILGAGAWSSGGTMNTARQALAGAGTKDDMIIAGGTPPTVAKAETYNGTSWANITDFPSVLEKAGSTGATTSAANIVGGDPGAKTSTQHWNGSGWTAGGSLSQGRANFQGSGPHTAGIVLCGQGSPNNTNCEKYNGTSWTAAGSLPTAVQVFGSSVAGTSGAAIGSGGYYDLRPSGSEAQTALTWSYDGSSWSTVNSMNSTRYQAMGGGTQGSAYVAGYPTSPRGTTTEQWDGTSWTTGAAMAAARAVGASAAAAGTSATVAGGNNTAGARLATSEEFALSTTIAVSAGWSSSDNLNTSRDSLMTAAQAPQNAAFVFGGHAGPTVTNSESYNGTAWTATNALPVSKQLGGGAGTQTAALCFAGQTAPPAVNRSTTESWDGSNWTAVSAPGGTLATARLNVGSAGVQGAALIFGGGPPTTATSEEWDGSNWSTGGVLTRGTTGADNICGAGIQTSALAMGGTAPSFVYDTTEEYNGTSWAGGGGMTTARRRAAGAASNVDSGIVFGGLASPGSGQTAASELYNGTSWTNTASMGTARYFLGGSGATQGDGFAFGGLLTGVASSYTNKTEEYTATGTALNYKTLTTS